MGNKKSDSIIYWQAGEAGLLYTMDLKTFCDVAGTSDVADSLGVGWIN